MPAWLLRPDRPRSAATSAALVHPARSRPPAGSRVQGAATASAWRQRGASSRPPSRTAPKSRSRRWTAPRRAPSAASSRWVRWDRRGGGAGGGSTPPAPRRLLPAPALLTAASELLLPSNLPAGVLPSPSAAYSAAALLLPPAAPLQVKGYPTLKVIHAGEAKESYSGQCRRAPAPCAACARPLPACLPLALALALVPAPWNLTPSATPAPPFPPARRPRAGRHEVLHRGPGPYPARRDLRLERKASGLACQPTERRSREAAARRRALPLMMCVRAACCPLPSAPRPPDRERSLVR